MLHLIFKKVKKCEEIAKGEKYFREQQLIDWQLIHQHAKLKIVFKEI